MTIPGIYSQRDGRWSNLELGFNTDPYFNLYHYGLVPVVSAVRRTESTLTQVFFLNLGNAASLTGISLTRLANMLVLGGGIKTAITNSARSSKADVMASMVLGMSFSRGQQKQVLQLVIELITVKVMNLLTSLKGSLQVLFHDVTMLVFHSSLYAKTLIPVIGNVSSFISRMVFTIVSLNHSMIAHGYAAFKRAIFFTRITRNNIYRLVANEAFLPYTRFSGGVVVSHYGNHTSKRYI